jgi:hypothetical protein
VKREIDVGGQASVVVRLVRASGRGRSLIGAKRGGAGALG